MNIEYLESGEKARLIPVVSDTSKEQRITSILLAAMMSVDEYGKGLLKLIGAPIRKTSVIEAYTEVVFKGQKGDKKIRPDGLITVRTGKKVWTALIEAKIGNNPLDTEQVESYLDLAKKHNIDSVITISNQFSSTLTHYPYKINKQKVRGTNLFHWSWHSLLIEALLWKEHKGVDDADQDYILSEFMRYVQHDSSGVTSSMRMHDDWKSVCQTVSDGGKLLKTAAEVENAVSSFYALSRCLSLRLTEELGVSVPIFITTAHKNDPIKRLQSDIDKLVTSQILEMVFDVPNAASRVCLVVDVNKKSLIISMKFEAPKDKSTIRGRIGWLAKQVRRTQNKDCLIHAFYAARSCNDHCKISDLEAHGYTELTKNNPKAAPTAFSINLVHNLTLTNLRSQKKFVEEAEEAVLSYYQTIGQYIQAWSPKTIKVKSEDAELDEEAA